MDIVGCSNRFNMTSFHSCEVRKLPRSLDKTSVANFSDIILTGDPVSTRAAVLTPFTQIMVVMVGPIWVGVAVSENMTTFTEPVASSSPALTSASRNICLSSCIRCSASPIFCSEGLTCPILPLLSFFPWASSSPLATLGYGHSLLKWPLNPQLKQVFNDSLAVLVEG